MNRAHFGLKPEDIATERQLAFIRLILSFTSAAVVVKLMSEVSINIEATIISITLLIVYSLVMRLIIQFKPQHLGLARVVSSILEVGLITHLIWATWFSSISPFYMWYVFYVVSLSVRYGAQISILGLAASIVLYTAVSMSPSNQILFVPGFLGNTGFLFILAFLFGHMSERQKNYQKQLLVANELAIQLASLSSSREMIEYLIEQTGELLELDKCWFIQIRADEEDGNVLFVHGVDLDQAHIDASLGGWSPGCILRSGKAYVSNRLSRDQQIPQDLVDHLGLTTLAAVPMFVRDMPMGVLYAANRPPRGFSQYDVQLLELLATQAAPVIENSQLWERLKDAAASEERLRIARDLHDNFLQTLAAIKLHLERCRMLVDKDTDRAKSAITRIHEIASQGLAEVRAYLSELRLMGPEPGRLGQAITRCVDEAASRAGFISHLEIDLPDTGISPQVSLTAFQVSRELLNNVVKHAGAENVWLCARVVGSDLVIELRDDGKGFTPPADFADLTAEGHLGLAGVKERVDAISGGITFEGAPGSGMKAVMRLPVQHLL